MKNHPFIIAFTVAISAQVCLAVHQPLLPEFKSTAGMDKSAPISSKPARNLEGDFFYTGRPFEGSQKEYLFTYRNYDSEVQRWKTSDPSGFPDGANNAIYAPTPTSDFDVQGLLKWSTLVNTHQSETWYHGGNTLTSEIWTVKTNDESATIILRKNTTGGSPGTNYAYNCHGYTFGHSEYWINGQVDAILKGDGYKKVTDLAKTGAAVAYWGGDIHTAAVQKIESGTVTKVTGKLGALGMQTSAPADQANGIYGSDISYWE